MHERMFRSDTRTYLGMFYGVYIGLYAELNFSNLAI